MECEGIYIRIEKPFKSTKIMLKYVTLSPSDPKGSNGQVIDRFQYKIE